MLATVAVIWLASRSEKQHNCHEKWVEHQQLENQAKHLLQSTSTSSGLFPFLTENNNKNDNNNGVEEKEVALRLFNYIVHFRSKHSQSVFLTSHSDHIQGLHLLPGDCITPDQLYHTLRIHNVIFIGRYPEKLQDLDHFTPIQQVVNTKSYFVHVQRKKTIMLSTTEELIANVNKATTRLYRTKFDSVCYAERPRMDRILLALKCIGYYPYSIFERNSQHWARWIMYGEWKSDALDKYVEPFQLLVECATWPLKYCKNKNKNKNKMNNHDHASCSLTNHNQHHVQFACTHLHNIPTTYHIFEKEKLQPYLWQQRHQFNTFAFSLPQHIGTINDEVANEIMGTRQPRDRPFPFLHVSILLILCLLWYFISKRFRFHNLTIKNK